MAPDEALQRLIAGNERFQRGEVRAPTTQAAILAQLAHGQAPYATILGCSDSRVPPELIFDAGLGELFVVRVAGNVFSPEVSGSLQYAGAHLGTALFVVLGHSDCGAVKAALDTKLRAVRQRSRVQMVVDDILPGLAGLEVGSARRPELDLAVEANVRWTMQQIRETPEGRTALAQGQRKLVGGIYDIGSGRVRFID